MDASTSYDCLIIGGGPAGLSAAVYMGRFLRRTLVIDSGEGRSLFSQVNDNYLGFPNGIKVQELRELGRQQAQRFGVEFLDGEVKAMSCAGDGRGFVAHTAEGTFTGRSVILCTGVRDIWPSMPGALDCVGKTLFWCITCDGFRALGKRLVLFGNDEEAATTAAQFLVYTNEIVFLASPGKLNCSAESIMSLEERGVLVTEGVPTGIVGTPEQIRAVRLEDGRSFHCDLMFSLLGCVPNTKLAGDLGVDCDRQGYIKVDTEGYTTVPGVFAAGDVSGTHTHQVATAAAEGAEAAQTANYYLYKSFQKKPEDRGRALAL